VEVNSVLFGVLLGLTLLIPVFVAGSYYLGKASKVVSVVAEILKYERANESRRTEADHKQG
jgi:hypothetical protein